MTTKVCTVEELYKLIPETQNIEGKILSTQKILIETLIDYIESSGKWQFVQIVLSKPSLYIVRMNEQKSQYDKNSISVTGLSGVTEKPKNKTPNHSLADVLPVLPLSESKLPWDSQSKTKW